MVTVKYGMKKFNADKIVALSILQELGYTVVKVDRETVQIELDKRVYTLVKQDELEVVDESGRIVLQMRFSGVSNGIVYYYVLKLLGNEIKNLRIDQYLSFNTDKKGVSSFA